MKNTNRIEHSVRTAVLLVAVCLLLAGNSFSQATSVTIEGIVTDQEGGVLPGATVNVRNVETGYMVGTIVRPNGSYIVSGLQPGKYEIEVNMDGFAPEKRQGLTFYVGSRLKIDFKLTLATLEEEVVVTAEAPMVEVSKSEISNVVDRQKIDDVPISLSDSSFEGWSYLSITTAGVQNDGRDQVGNAQGRGYGELVVDGVSYERVATGRARAGIPADAIQEFRVITNQFQAEYGNSSDLLRSAITRSGTNEFQGRISYFYRNEAFSDVNYFVNHREYQGEELPEDSYSKPEFRTHRIGGFFGGPIIKDKTHFFLCFDGMRQRTYATINSPLVPRETVPVDRNTDRLMIKLNHQLNEKNLFVVRYNLDKPTTYNSMVGGYNTMERAIDYYRSVHDGYVGWTLYASPNSLNELRFQYSRQEDDIRPLSPDTYAIERPSGKFGKAPNMAQGSVFNRYQIADNFNLFLEKHSLKFGFDFSYAPWHFYIERAMPGVFYFLTDAPFDANNPDTYPFRFEYSVGDPAVDIPYTTFGIFVQDSWKINSQLTLNLGLRYNIFDMKYAHMDKWNIKNFNPRIGFSWDPLEDGKTNIRGGIGTYSANFPANPLTNIAFDEQLATYTIMFPNYPDAFAPNPFFTPMPGSTTKSINDAKQDQIAPYTLQTTLGAEREIFTDFSVGADLVWTKGYNLARLAQLNPVIPGTSYVRVDTTLGNWYQLTDTGKSEYKGLLLTIKKRFSKGWSLDIAYTLSESKSDTESETTRPDNYEDPLNERMFGYTNMDARHRLAVTGIVNLPLGFQVTGLFYYNSATPWNAIYPNDVNRDGLASDYVDEYRNSRRGFDFYFLNLRISKYFNIGKVRAQLIAEGYNITNRVNFSSIYNRYGSSRFGLPTRAGDPRQLQLGIRLDF